MTLDGFGLSFHHLGLAVTRPKEAVGFLLGLGYDAGEPVRDPLQNVDLIWCTHPHMPAVEVIASTGTPGPLDEYLKHFTELVYHLSYRCAVADDSVQAMRAVGHRIVCLSPPKPSMLFEGHQVSFYMVMGFGLIELVQDKQAT